MHTLGDRDYQLGNNIRKNRVNINHISEVSLTTNDNHTLPTSTLYRNPSSPSPDYINSNREKNLPELRRSTRDISRLVKYDDYP